MKAKLISQMIAVSAMATGSIATMSQSSYGQTTTYFCGMSKDGVPTTFTRTATGQKIAVIRW